MFSHLTARAKFRFLLFDFALLLVCGVFASHLRTGVDIFLVLEAPSLYLVSVIQLIFLYIFGCYDFDRRRTSRELFSVHLVALVCGVVLTISLNYFFQKDRSGLFGRGVLSGFLVGFYSTSFLYRNFLRLYFSKLETSSEILFLGVPTVLESLKAEFAKKKHQGQRTFVDFSQFDRALLQKRWSSIVIGLRREDMTPEQGEWLMDTRFEGGHILDLNSFYERFWRKLPIYNLGPEWFITSDGFRLVANPIGLRIKRLFDLGLSLALLSIVWPLMLLTVVAIKLDSHGSALYRQIRTGLNDQTFTILKFRSMRSDAEARGAQWAQESDSRVTRVGKFIRLTRLDELPQLWNVFRGDMSFIGPRPERPEFNELLEKEIPYYKLRHLVRPGITGWAQVMYPYGASVEDAREKLQFDLYYIKNYNLLLDLKILLKTISVVAFGRGR